MIKLNKINKIYNIGQSSEIVALLNVNMEFQDKGLVLIKGHSGSGKTTLLNIISNLEKPTSGDIDVSYDGNFYSMVFQDFQLIDYLTISENLDLACKIIGDFAKKDYLCAKYGIEEILNHYPNEISGGQKQRVSIIRALILNKPVLLCDEPTGNLDIDNSNMIAEMLKKESENRLVIVVSHDNEVFEPVASRIIELYKGTIKSDNIIEEVKINNETEYNNNVIFDIKTALFLLSKFIKKNILRHIFLVISLLLTFLILISSLNFVTNKSYVIRNNAYASNDYNAVDFSKYSNYDYNLMDYEEIQYFSMKLETDEYFYLNYNGFLMDDILVNKIIISNNCDYNILFGRNNLFDNEIIISDYNAKYISSDISNVIGSTINGLKIVGIFESNYEEYTEDDSRYAHIAGACFITESSKSCLAGDELYVRSDESNYLSVFNQNTSSDLIYGNINYLNNSIGLSKGLAQIYNEDVSSLIGQNIEINYLLGRGENKKTLTKEYNVAFIYDDLDSNISVSNELYNDFFINISEYYYSDSNGIRVTNYNKNTFNKAIKLGLLDNTELSVTIDEGLDFVYNITLVSFFIGLVLIIISIIIVINYVHNIFEKEKRTQGILMSFGINKSKVTLLYYFDVIIFTIIPYLLSLLLELGVIIFINKLALHKNITTITPLYYDFGAVGISFSILIIVSFLIYLLVKRRLKKKNIIDIIYQR
ncbi:MAG: ATP-binding cassette domain-containing protein [Acholeplasmatales bacterium]|nr:ATP-binding cassette domain-containing protein [Acholeplasmatales bacterium]